jgi:hypothetical protein
VFARSGAVALAAIALAGCGYRLIGAPATAEARSIELVTFENRTSAPGFERMLAEALSEEFARRGELRAVRPGSSATDLALRGVVRQLTVVPSAFSSVSLELENRVEVVVEVALFSGADRVLLWRDERLSEAEHFLSSADAQVRESNREQALRRIAADLAARIHDELTQTF